MVIDELLEVLFFEEIEELLAFKKRLWARYTPDTRPENGDAYWRESDAFLLERIPDKAAFAARCERYAAAGTPTWQGQAQSHCDVMDADALNEIMALNTAEIGALRVAMYERARDTWAVHLDDYAREVNRDEGSLILELATGAGGGTAAVATGFRAGSRMISADIDYGCAQNAERIARHLGMTDRLCGIAANFWYLPFADGTFDAVCTHYGLDESGELGRVVAEVCRVLKPGGRFVVTARVSPFARHGRVAAMYGLDEAEFCALARTARFYSGVEGLTELAEKFGLALVKRSDYAPTGGHARFIAVFEKRG
ncbi:MAG: class I SAM-dependent methyltransferase [Oscillospiraceae bacterium]|jgi:SAM-dependent methyltransferase|nr:class I SAM-dependent methyltransferase [Oscillospiraceae bacterium]